MNKNSSVLNLDEIFIIEGLFYLSQDITSSYVKNQPKLSLIPKDKIPGL